MEKKELLGLFPDELAEELAEYRLPGFRVKQIFQWLHRGADFGDMTNLPKALREQLAERYIAQPVSVLQKKVSALDGTVKLLYALPDGNCVEGVLMHYHHGDTLCLSTQVGCRMGCVFCASTLNGCVRNLTAAEMLGQVHCANAQLDGGHVSNLVLMGSGEPLDNYNNVTRFLRLVSHPEGLNIGLRHISLSTCGLVPRMRRTATILYLLYIALTVLDFVFLRIGGMTCENCARKVENALNRLDGTWAIVSISGGSAKVLSKTPPDEAAIREAVRGAGYVVTDYRLEERELT